MDCGPRGTQSHPSQIRLFVREAESRSRTVIVGGQPRPCMGRGRVSHNDESLQTSSLFNNPTGNMHQRQRRAMTPAFGPVEAKGSLPYFMDSVNKASGLRLHPKVTQILAVRWQTSGVVSSRTTSQVIRLLLI